MDEVRTDWRTPKPNRLAADDPHRSEILMAHDAALKQGDTGYLDPATGWWVFSAAYLAAREACCGNGCRHCPYV
ncbi:MAG: hypothetical protein F2911_08350 [Actinobacteria bacterium]|nr:hypothetical protein [Actinomycetota bacterium]MSW37458.1 hypothetical protein [Actinomycetota bacterium]MSX38950.1 hypothetical protein [Actinomycetota bacterium]